jgi:hypothetical protein
MGNLDNYDPTISDALALGREVILTTTPASDSARVRRPGPSPGWRATPPR